MDARRTRKELLRLGIEAWYSPQEDILRYRPQELVSEELRKAMAVHKHALVALARQERAERGEPMQSEAEVLNSFRERARRREGARM